MSNLLSDSQRISEHNETTKDLKLLLEPGSSLGGARPKASIINSNGKLAIAKFPKKDDNKNIVTWEAICLLLAKNSGLNVSNWHKIAKTYKISNNEIEYMESAFYLSR